MARRKRTIPRLPGIWEVDDELWNIIQPILDERDPSAPTGRPRIDPRRAFNGVIHQTRTGGQWNQLPQPFGDDASVHRTMQRWIAKGVLGRLWAGLIENCADLVGVSWQG